MDSFGLSGKYWLLPGGQVIDCSAYEHAGVALAHMLHLPVSECRQQFGLNDLHTPFSEALVSEHANRGVELNVLKFLSTPDKEGRIDPRVHAIREYGWIRCRSNAFYVWTLDAAALKRIFDAKEFWHHQPTASYETWIDIHQVENGEKFGCTLKTWWMMNEDHVALAARMKN